MLAARYAPGLILGCLAAFSLAVPTQAGSAYDARNYELAFDNNSRELARGDWAAFNEATLNRIATLLKRIEGWQGVRLVFAGPRPSCAQKTACDAEKLTWLRIQRVLATVRDHLKDGDARLVPGSVSMAFSDEIEGGGLPSMADSLTLLMEHRTAGEKCSGAIRLEDASLPLDLAEGRPVYGFPLNKGESVPVDENTELFFSDTAANPMIVWEDGHGRFRKQDASGNNRHWRLPPGAEALYLIAAPRNDSEASRFGSSLGNEFAALPRPSFLPPVKGASQRASLMPADRGFDDNPHRVQPGTIRPGPGAGDAAGAPGSEVAVCDFEFVRRP